MAHTAHPKRRSKAEWKKLLRTWQRSGRSASDFAAEHHVNARTLAWWQWYLRRRKLAPAPAARSPRLVAIEVVPNDDGQESNGVAWELRDARGLVLRVQGTIAAPDLERVLQKMSVQ